MSKRGLRVRPALSKVLTHPIMVVCIGCITPLNGENDDVGPSHKSVGPVIQALVNVVMPITKGQIKALTAVCQTGQERGFCGCLCFCRFVSYCFDLCSWLVVSRVSVPEQPAGVLKIILVKRLVNDEFEALPVIPVLALPGKAADDMKRIFNKMSDAKGAEPAGKGVDAPDSMSLRQQVWVDYYRHLLWDIDAFLDGFWTDADPDMDPETFESVMDTVLSYLLGVEAHHAAAFLLREAQGAGWQVNFHGTPVQSISAEYLKTLTERPS